MPCFWPRGYRWCMMCSAACANDRSKGSLLRIWSLECVGRNVRLRSETSSGASGAGADDVWTSGNLEIWRSGNLEVWRIGNMEPGNLEIWGPKKSPKWKFPKSKSMSLFCFCKVWISRQKTLAPISCHRRPFPPWTKQTCSNDNKNVYVPSWMALIDLSISIELY